VHGMGAREYLGCLGLLAIGALLTGASLTAVLFVVASKFLMVGLLAVPAVVALLVLERRSRS
jgi:hypothetical protein